MGQEGVTDETRFQPSERVRVQRWTPPGHVRTPYYLRGHVGTVESIAGTFRNPEELAYGQRDAHQVPLYRVSFATADIWPDRVEQAGDRIVADIFEHWLERAD